MSRKRPQRWFASLELLLGYFSAFLDAQNELLHGHRDTLWAGKPVISPQRQLSAPKSAWLVSRYHRNLKPPELQKFASRKVKCYLPRAAFEIGQLVDHIHPSAFDPVLITKLRKAREDVLKYVTSASPALEGREIEHQFAELLDHLESLPTIKKNASKSAADEPLTASIVVSPKAMEPTENSSELVETGRGTGTDPKYDSDPPEKTALTPNEEMVFEVLTDVPMTGRDILAKLARQNHGKLDLAALSRICNKSHMQARGVRNRKGAGYYKLITK